ncbi:DUF4860 domain-containing protein [Raoultibacter timonensis]|uniref:DUF4860 domain-containing protein n=1 Tax=Raoultibacter timonensis TaxID=1907662 RepID=UPI0026DD806F|nr:DUF4860 domain-containing protein [Raoultibacter timonensis]
MSLFTQRKPSSSGPIWAVGGAQRASSQATGRSSRVFVVALFALIVLSLLSALIIGMEVYKSIAADRAAADDTRLGLSLIANSIHAADSADSVGMGAGPEGDSLVLIERDGDSAYETRIYLFEGRIVEEYATAEAPYTPEKATAIVDSQTFAFDYGNGLLTVQTDQGSASVYLRSTQGGQS